MKRSKFSEEQGAYALPQAERGTPVAAFCRQLGVSEATFYVWKKKYAHLGVSVLRACAWAQFSRAGWYRRSRARDRAGAPATDSRLGARTPSVRVQQDLGAAAPGRLAGEQEAGAPSVSPGGAAGADAGAAAEAHAPQQGAGACAGGPQERWSMAFVHDQLAEGRPFRVLTVIDQWRRQSPTLEPALAISGRDVAITWDRVLGAGAGVDHRGSRHRIHVAGPEHWAYQRGVQLDFLRPGEPVENAHVESLNGRLRYECLNSTGPTAPSGT